MKCPLVRDQLPGEGVPSATAARGSPLVQPKYLWVQCPALVMLLPIPGHQKQEGHGEVFLKRGDWHLVYS